MNDLRNHDLVYLNDDTPVLQEVISDFPTWQGRSPEERNQLTHLLHDYAVGEDWAEGDSWSDVSFSKEEIQRFSAHIRVACDNGLPEWYPASSPALTSSSL